MPTTRTNYVPQFPPYPLLCACGSISWTDDDRMRGRELAHCERCAHRQPPEGSMAAAAIELGDALREVGRNVEELLLRWRLFRWLVRR